MFSYLKALEYVEFFEKEEYEKLFVAANFSVPAYKLLENNPSLNKLLYERGVPKFDRYFKGLYFWMRKVV